MICVPVGALSVPVGAAARFAAKARPTQTAAPTSADAFPFMHSSAFDVAQKTTSRSCRHERPSKHSTESNRQSRRPMARLGLDDNFDITIENRHEFQQALERI